MTQNMLENNYYESWNQNIKRSAIVWKIERKQFEVL